MDSSRQLEASKAASLDRRALLIFALCLPFSNIALAGESRRPIVKVAVDDLYAPISEMDAQGHFSGMVEAGIDAVNTELGWAIEYSAPPWKRAQEYIRQGTLDAFCTLRTAEREAYVWFAAEPLFTLDSGWAHFAADNPRAAEIRQIRTIEQLRRFRIAVWRGAAWPNDLMGEGWTTTELTGLDLIDPMLRTHRLDLYLESPQAMQFYQRKAGKPPLDKVRIDFLPGSLNSFVFGLRKSYESAHARIREFDAAQMKLKASGALDKALAPFFS